MWSCGAGITMPSVRGVFLRDAGKKTVIIHKRRRAWMQPFVYFVEYVRNGGRREAVDTGSCC